jgi:hypothetical protein
MGPREGDLERRKHMATTKASKSSKHLRKAKKLEASKPLVAKGAHIGKVVISMMR